MDSKTYLRLGIMMFLEFFIWGAWFVTLGTYLGDLHFGASQITTIYAMNNVAAIISPFFVGMIADRFFPSQTVMGILHLVGAALMYWSATIPSYGLLVFSLLLYNLAYMPTLALVNAISFRQMQTPEKQFPKVRVWGTAGWIVAGLVISFILSKYYGNQVEHTAVPLKMAAIASALLGLYSFTLPSTPPQNVGKKITAGDIIGVKALGLLKQKPFFIFVLCSLLISLPLAFYYSFTNLFLNSMGMEKTVAAQSLGQASEVGFMILMPFFFSRLGVKKMLLVGMLAWVVRYIFFGSGNLGPLAWMIYAGILMHGVCYDFFFVTGQIYVDKKASKDIRASAQGFITLVTYGVGIGLGNLLAGWVGDAFKTGTVNGNAVYNWKMIWWIPAIFAAAIALFFAVTFKDREADQISPNSLEAQPASGD